MSSLIPSFDPQGLPASLWVLWSLKVFGFWLHLVFMGLWFAGFPAGLLLRLREDTRPLGNRLLKWMPVWIAFGVNAGVVPLLFLQVLYPGLFYTSTILQAWWWFAVIPLVMVAYYGTYVYVIHGLREEVRAWTHFVGWGSALIFLFLGVLFASTLTLTVHPEFWTEFAGNQMGGAFRGTWLFASFEVFQRYAMVWGLGLLTTAAFLVLDLQVLRPDASLEDQARPVVLGLVMVGSLVFLLASLPYLARIKPYLPPVWHAGVGLPMILVFLLAWAYAVKGGRTLGLALVFLQLLALVANAIARQVVQHAEIRRVYPLREVPIHFQASPLALFLVTLVLGLVAVGWMLRVYVRSARRL